VCQPRGLSDDWTCRASSNSPYSYFAESAVSTAGKADPDVRRGTDRRSQAMDRLMLAGGEG
jgi:hypothetical protein